MATPMEIVKQKKEEALKRLAEKGKSAPKKVYVGMATCEIAAGSKEPMEVFEKAIASGGLTGVYLSQKGCAGRCNLEPTVEVYEEGKSPVKYVKVTRERAEQILERHLKKGEVITEWTVA